MEGPVLGHGLTTCSFWSPGSSPKIRCSELHLRFGWRPRQIWPKVTPLTLTHLGQFGLNGPEFVLTRKLKETAYPRGTLKNSRFLAAAKSLMR